MSALDVSVVVPALGREGLVVEAVQSALAQRGVEVEVIVLDDSADGSAKKAIEGIGDARVRYVKREASSGRAALIRNEGAKLARGRYLNFLDDDDQLASGALHALAKALDVSPKAGMAFGAIVPFGEDEVDLRVQRAYFRNATNVARRAKGRMRLVSKLLFGNPPFVSSACLVRREHVEWAGGHDLDVPCCEDTELYARIIRAYGFVFVDRPILRFRTGVPSVHDGNGQAETLRVSYERIHSKYREAHGALEFYALKAFARLT